MQQHRVENDHEDQILEAIDQLRRRKARPDADRICNYLLRKFSVDARDTIAELHRLIEAEKVIQVDYKGNTSYRNASKWSRLQLYKNRPEGFVKEKLNSSMIAGAVAELVVEEPDYLDQGVPAYRLVEQLLDGVSNPTSRRMVEDFLAKEVANGNIAKLANGNYSLVESSDMTVPISSNSAITIINDTTITAASQQLDNNNHQRQQSKNQEQKETEESEQRSVDVASRCWPNENGSIAKLAYSSATFPEATITEVVNNKSPVTLGLYEFDDNDANIMVTDSRLNTPRLSIQNCVKSNEVVVVAEKTVRARKEVTCYEITVGKEPDSPEESVTKEDIVVRSEKTTTLPTMSILETKTEVSKIAEARIEEKKIGEHLSNLKRPAKADRKQRLQVRTEDPMDIEMKFEDYRQMSSKEERDKEHVDVENGQNSDERDDEDAERSSTNPSPTPSNATAATTASAIRSARRKRAKKVFDPSDNNVVKRKRGRPFSTNKAAAAAQESQDSNKSVTKEGPNRHCSLCAKSKDESLVACRDCTVRAHPTCIYPADELVQKSGSSWQCERCKSCTVCCETSDVGPLITCNSCDEAYHYSCHTPRVSGPKANSKWKCSECTQKHFKPNVPQSLNLIASRPVTPSHTAVLPPVLSPQVSPTRTSDDQNDEETSTRDGIDPNIPDASDWTSEQVYQYFARLFPKEAEVFRVQDIDGHSLLLMKRSDVLSGLDLLLGPALKIYRHVLKLQMRRDDQRLYWL